MTKDLKVLASGECTLSKNQQTVSGIAALAQRFMIELLTISGSMQYLPNRGCNFLSRVRVAKTEYDVMIAFGSSVNRVRRNLHSDETGYMPADARYGSVKLNRIVLVEGSLRLELTVRSKANTFAHVFTPEIKLWC